VFFFFGCEKKPTDVSQQSAPFSIFFPHICYANEGCHSNGLCARVLPFREKGTQACAAINFFPSLWMNNVPQRHTVSLLKNKARVHGVLSSLFEYIKYSV
jgi:hypothetical protein